MAPTPLDSPPSPSAHPLGGIAEPADLPGGRAPLIRPGPVPLRPTTPLERLRTRLDRFADVVHDRSRTSRRVLVVLAATVAAAVVAAGLLLRAPTPPPVEASIPTAAPGGGSPGAASDSGQPATTGGTGVADSGSGTASPLVVDVAGAVAAPGLVRLGAGARVADAIAAAGGPAPDADLERVNQAAHVADGDRLYVPRRGQADVPAPVNGSGGSGPGSPAPAAGSGPTVPVAPLDLNSATVEQLDALPGVGPSTARAIVDFRAAHGRFRSVDGLLEVRGIGQAKLEALRSRVRV